MGGPEDPVVECLPTMREAHPAMEEKTVGRSEAWVTSRITLKTALYPLSRRAFPVFCPSTSLNVTFLVLFSACYTAFIHTFVYIYT